jgi:hypothetical protein
MIITMCSKFGTRAGVVAVGMGEGMKVGRTGVGADVGERIGAGTPDGTTVGGALVVQEANKIKTSIHRPKRFI